VDREGCRPLTGAGGSRIESLDGWAALLSQFRGECHPDERTPMILGHHRSVGSRELQFSQAPAECPLELLAVGDPADV
jgi:hypothetical protein